MTISLLNDVGIWPLWAYIKEIDRSRKVLERFIGASTIFTPYYDNDAHFISDNKDIKVSHYCNENDCLAIVGNISLDIQSAYVCPNDLIVTSAVDCFNVSLESQNHQLLNYRRN